MKAPISSLVVSLVFLFACLGSATARDEGPSVGYFPQTENVEGDQPLYHTYDLEITSPSNLPAGPNVPITPVLFVIAKPAGVSDEEALSYVHLVPASLAFNGPGQKRVTTVVSDFPVGTAAGEYAFGIRTPGWGVPVTDTFGFINAKVYPPRTRELPAVTINSPANGTVYYWPAGGPAVEVPVQFTATAPEEEPVFGIDADISGTFVSLNEVSGLNTARIEAGGKFYLAQGGLFTVTARATNDVGTASDSVEFSVVVVGGPPTVSISSPTTGSTYSLPAAGGSVSVPFIFCAKSVYGEIHALTATMNDQPVEFTASGLNTTQAQGSVSLPITAAGIYHLAVTAANEFGTNAATTHFTVTVNVPTPPPPTVTINTPTNGTVITRVAGSPATEVPYSFTAVAGTGWTISAVGASFQGDNLSVTATGLGTRIADGTGLVFVSAPGTYTLTATGTSEGITASATTTFSVVETAPPSACGVNWLLPVQLAKAQKAGSTIAIKFELDCRNEWSLDRNNDGDPDFYPGQRTKSKDDIDYTVIIAITEILPDGTTTAPQLFAYSANPKVPGYTIQGNDMYHLNFPSAKGARQYQIEIFHSPTEHGPVLLATRRIQTK
jgi:hypothetical protein